MATADMTKEKAMREIPDADLLAENKKLMETIRLAKARMFDISHEMTARLSMRRAKSFTSQLDEHQLKALQDAAASELQERAKAEASAKASVEKSAE